MLILPLVERAAVQTAPAIAGPVEAERHLFQNLVQPTLTVPIGFLELVPTTVENRCSPNPRPLQRSPGFNGSPHLLLQNEGWFFTTQVEQLNQRLAQRQPGLRQPHGVYVGADEVLVGQIEARRRHRTRHHELRALEEVLVVRAPHRTVTVDQGGLAAAARPPAPLRVVGRVGRDVAHVDHVELGDINPQLHGGRTEEDGESPLAETLFPLFPVRIGHLSGVLPGLDADDGAGRVLVETEKELVGATATRGRTRHADEVVVGGDAVTRPPNHGRRRNLVSRNFATLPFAHGLHQTGPTQNFEQLPDDDLRLCHRQPLRVVRPSGRAPEILTEASPPREEEVLFGVIAPRGAWEHQTRSLELLALVDGPRRAEVLTALLLQAFLRLGLQEVHFDGEPTPHPIEHGARDGTTLLWSGGHQSRVSLRPLFFGGTKLL